MKRGSAGQRSAIEAALLDYRQSPGKYAIAGKQPPLLFACITQVLQLASGRSPEGLEAPAPSPQVQEAAGVFIRSALLYPDADHYALLGLDRGADAAAIKDRYRLMMRLMHPDFSSASTGESWPADAASRLNQAYEILSSPGLRRAYDEQFGFSPASRPAANEVRPPRAAFRPAAPRTTNTDARQGLKRLATAFGAAGILALLAVLWAGMASERESLVQRTKSGRPTTIAAILADVIGPPLTQRAPAPAQASSAPLPAALAARSPAISDPATPSEQGRFSELPLTARSGPAAPEPATGTSGPAQIAVGVAPAATPITAVPAAQPRAPASPRPPTAAAGTSSLQPAADAKQPVSGVTLAEVHPLLSKLLGHMESGWGDRVINMLEREARSAPAAQAWLHDYNDLVDGARPVKLSHIEFKSEPREGRLLVRGQVIMQLSNQGGETPGRPFSLQAEFAKHEGNVVMTRLARAQDN